MSKCSAATFLEYIFLPDSVHSKEIRIRGDMNIQPIQIQLLIGDVPPNSTEIVIVPDIIIGL